MDNLSFPFRASRGLAVLAALLFFAMSSVARAEDATNVVDSNYLFDGNFDDEADVYDLSLLGLETENYVTRDNGQALELADRTFLEVPQQMHADLQLDKSLHISVDFLFRDTGEDESIRVILSNKDWAYDIPGLKITAFNEKIEWQPDGIIFVQFNIGVGDREIATRFFDLPMNVWHNAAVTLDFEANTVVFSVNGRKLTKSLTEAEGGELVDPSQFISALGSKPFRLGVHQSFDGGETEWRNEFDIENGNTTTSNLAEVLIDNFIVQSPRPAGDTTVIINALSKLTGHLTEAEPLTDVEISAYLTDLRQNLPGTDFSAFATQAKAFITAHQSVYGAIYRILERNNIDNVVYDELPDVSKAYVDLGVWLLEQGLTPENASSAEGLVFVEHREFPGALADGAERVTSGTADIRAEFVRDPAYLMGGMKLEPDSELAAYLYRPTGFYAPAGELVTVNVDPSWVNSGLHIRVGAHADNHISLSSTSRFPLLSVDYRIESETLQVINPFGGNIYVLVPQDTDLGWNQVEFLGAVRAPYFSTRAGYKTPADEWQNIRQYPGVWTDFESDKFMITVPTAQLQSFNQPTLLLERWDQIMDIMQTVHGRPLERSRAEAFLLDATQLVIGSYPGGYPVTPGLYAEGANGITDGSYSPFAVLRESFWEQDLELAIMLHELGHHHFGRFITEGEQESYVNVPAMAVLNQMYGLSLDDSLSNSEYQKFSRTDAAIDWMVTHNFRNGNKIGYDPTTQEPQVETSYQARGHAKYADIADIFDGWDALGTIYNVFYQEDLASGSPPGTQEDVSHDEFLLKASNALGCNLASLFHFWGIHPSNPVVAQLSALPVCDGAYDRVVHYLNNAPRTNEELSEFHAAKTAVSEFQLNAEVWAGLLVNFDGSYGQQIRDIGAQILANYFGIAADQPPSEPTPKHSSFNFDPVNRNDVYFSWRKSVDPEGQDISYSFVLKREDNGEVVFSKTWQSGTNVTIDGEEFYQALSNTVGTTNPTTLIQQVTTSDTFTVVQSDVVTTQYTLNQDSDRDGLSDEEERALGTDANNPDSDGDGADDGFEVYARGTDPRDPLNVDNDDGDDSDPPPPPAGLNRVPIEGVLMLLLDEFERAGAE